MEENKKTIEEAVAELVEEYGCVDYESCSGHKHDIKYRLYTDYGFSIEEIANFFGEEPYSVKSSIAKVKKRIKKSNKEEQQEKKQKQTNKTDVSYPVDVEFDKTEVESDLGLVIDNPYSDYIPSKIIVHGKEYLPEELVAEFGSSGLRLLKIVALTRVLRHGPCFRTVPLKFVKVIYQTLLMNTKLVDDYNVLSALLFKYRIEENLINLAFSVLSYLDQQYKTLAETVDKAVPVINSWIGIERDGEVVFAPNQVYPSSGYQQPLPTLSNQNQINPVFANPLYNPPYQPQAYYPSATIPASQVNPPVPTNPTSHHVEEMKRTLQEKDKEIEELKDMVQQLLEEKRRKEEEERERRRMEEIANLIESKISSISSRISMLEMKLNKSPQNEDSEKELLLKQIEMLKDELKSMKDELTRKEIESLKSMIESLEKRLESRNNFFPDTLNQYMLEFMTKKLEAEAELAKAKETSKTLENIFSTLKESFRETAEQFGKAIGRTVATTPSKVSTVCPHCGSKFTFDDSSSKVYCPSCGKLIIRSEESKPDKTVKSNEPEEPEELNEPVEEETLNKSEKDTGNREA